MRTRTPYWWGVIEKAAERKASGKKAFTSGQEDRSANWVTCACGKQDERIHRMEAGTPYDTQLQQLGIEFCRAVCEEDNPRVAATVLRKIERRAGQIIRDCEL